jgi:hypothetical protein
MAKKPKVNKSWNMDTDKFIDIWVEALAKKPSNQWSYMLKKCWETFSVLEKNANHLNAKLPGWDDKDYPLHKAYDHIKSKVYSKCSNIRSSMKDNTDMGKPRFPDGRDLKGKVSVDWEKEASKFTADSWEPVEEDSTEPESEDET